MEMGRLPQGSLSAGTDLVQEVGSQCWYECVSGHLHGGGGVSGRRPPLPEARVGMCGRRLDAEYWKESAGSRRPMAQHIPDSGVVRPQVQVVSCLYLGQKAGIWFLKEQRLLG